MESAAATPLAASGATPRRDSNRSTRLSSTSSPPSQGLDVHGGDDTAGVSTSQRSKLAQQADRLKNMLRGGTPLVGGVPSDAARLAQKMQYYSTMRVHMKRVQYALEEEKRNSFYKELLVYLLFLAIMMTTVCTLPIQVPFEHNDALEQAYLDQEFNNVSFKKNFYEVDGLDEMWQWFNDVLLDTYYHPTELNVRRISSIQVRSGRMQGMPCELMDTGSTLSLFPDEVCYPAFSLHQQDTSPYISSSDGDPSVVSYEKDLPLLGELDKILRKIHELADLTPRAEANVRELPEYCQGKYDETLRQIIKDGAGMSFSGNISVHDAKERKHIVCLGAGLVSAPLVEYLTRDPNHSLTVVSGLPGEASAMAQKFTKKNRAVKPATVDVGRDPRAVAALVAEADCVVSLLPAPMHVNIAKLCLDASTPLVTASYISPEMQALHAQAQAQRIPILCELGLDPGMDHMSAMKIIDQVQAQNGRVVSFSSVCGGLPAPEAADNPIAYKFSWSPRGVLMAALNAAQYRKNGHVVHVPGEDLLTAAERVNFLPAFALEQIPNRNSLPYADIYNIPDAKSVYRGTLRYAGNCSIMHQCRLLGLMNPNPETLPATWPELVAKLKAKKSSLRPDAEAFLTWLGLDDPSALVDPSATCTIDAFCALLIQKLSYLPGERDMAI
ncbi:hypothetical protein DYB25_007309, partial [Aphanomyces astaci]